jgi:hypothetical protein
VKKSHDGEKRMPWVEPEHEMAKINFNGVNLPKILSGADVE